MFLVTGMTFFFIITWLALFCHAAWDILGDLRHRNVPEDMVNIDTVRGGDDYGTIVDDEYCDGV